jgi:hypothetical protein
MKAIRLSRSNTNVLAGSSRPPIPVKSYARGLCPSRPHVDSAALAAWAQHAYRIPLTASARITHEVWDEQSRQVSGLEAFSLKPSRGGVAALAVRRTAETRGANGEFLSYYPQLLSARPSSFSRVKPTCLTTV